MSKKDKEENKPRIVRLNADRFVFDEEGNVRIRAPEIADTLKAVLDAKTPVSGRELLVGIDK
jgi:hypothetical protein